MTLNVHKMNINDSHTFYIWHTLVYLASKWPTFFVVLSYSNFLLPCHLFCSGENLSRAWPNELWFKFPNESEPKWSYNLVEGTFIKYLARNFTVSYQTEALFVTYWSELQRLWEYKLQQHVVTCRESSRVLSQGVLLSHSPIKNSNVSNYFFL